MGYHMAVEGAHPPTCWIPAPTAIDGTPVARRCRPHDSSSSSTSSGTCGSSTSSSTRLGQVRQQQSQPQQLLAQVPPLPPPQQSQQLRRQQQPQKQQPHSQQQAQQHMQLLQPHQQLQLQQQQPQQQQQQQQQQQPQHWGSAVAPPVSVWPSGASAAAVAWSSAAPQLHVVAAHGIRHWPTFALGSVSPLPSAQQFSPEEGWSLMSAGRVYPAAGTSPWIETPPRLVRVYVSAAPPPPGPGLCDLPVEIMQGIADLLPTFGTRARLTAISAAARPLQWRLAAPYRLDEELSGLGLRSMGARAVALAFGSPQSASLGELCLGSNNIGDEGATFIATILSAPGSALRRLSLPDNNIGDVGAWALAAALATNTTLEELDLWGNPIGELGKQTILSTARCAVFLELDRPPAQALSLRTPVNTKMRSILFDWISQVHTGVNAPVGLDGAPDPQDMLFRTFSHMDAYLAHRNVERAKLQLTGVACTLAAARLDGSSSAEDAELATWLAFVTDGACTSEEVREAAREVQQVLGFKLHQPTAYTFLRRYLRRTGWTEESFSLANYLIELAAIDSSFLQFRPQAVAAAAAVLSRQYLLQGISVRHMQRWKAKLLRCAHVDLQTELAPCAAAMARLHAAQHCRPNMFVNKKYEWARLHMVAKITPNTPSDAAFFVNYLRSELAP